MEHGGRCSDEIDNTIQDAYSSKRSDADIPPRQPDLFSTGGQIARVWTASSKRNLDTDKGLLVAINPGVSEPEAGA